MRNWLKDIRENKRFNLSEMAEFLEVPVQTYRSYEFGLRNPTVKQAKVLAKKLKVNWTIFFDNK